MIFALVCMQTTEIRKYLIDSLKDGHGFWSYEQFCYGTTLLLRIPNAT